MAVKDAVFAQAFGLCGHHVVFLDLIQKGIFGQKRCDRKSGNGRRRNRQDNVPKVIEDLSNHGQLFEIV